MSQLALITGFIRSLGIEVAERPLRRATRVPGIDILRGTLVADERRMCKPADLLHEAAHIALTPSAGRPALDGWVDGTPAQEVQAIAWTWAAAVHLGIAPVDVFHDEVLSGNGPTLRANFSTGHYVGVPGLQRLRMTHQSIYPRMTRWIAD